MGINKRNKKFKTKRKHNVKKNNLLKVGDIFPKREYSREEMIVGMASMIVRSTLKAIKYTLEENPEATQTIATAGSVGKYTTESSHMAKEILEQMKILVTLENENKYHFKIEVDWKDTPDIDEILKTYLEDD